MDEGPPSSYLLLAKDTPVYCSDGLTAGTVKEVLREPDKDIFDGLVVATRDGDRYLAAELVAAIHERGVDITLPYEKTGELPAPARHRHIKYDLAADERPWIDVVHWLCGHLAVLLHPNDPRLKRAHEHLAEREKAKRLAVEDPQLALEAGVGRPDLPGSYHGGLIDVNHAPLEVIATLPTFNTELAKRLVAVREQVDGFSSLEDLGSVLDLTGDQVERLRAHVVCLPH
jgi:Helix-hairpin-helix motif